MTESLKRCTKCGEIKPLVLFMFRHGKPTSWCNSCNISNHNKWIDSEHGRNRRIEYMRDYRKRDRVKIQARAIANRAVLKGILQPQPCEVCGCDFAHKHHEDYSKPLAVRWFCSAHHAEIHRPKYD